MSNPIIYPYKTIYPVTDVILKKQGSLCNDVSKFYKKGKILYPITEEYVVKHHTNLVDEEFLDSYDGKILEYFNTLPNSSGDSAFDVYYLWSWTVSTELTCAYKNFIRGFDYQLGSNIYYNDDRYSLYFEYLTLEEDNYIGDQVPYGDNYWEYYLKYGGCRGVCVSAEQAYISSAYVNGSQRLLENQLISNVGHNSEGIINFKDTAYVEYYKANRPEKYGQFLVWSRGKALAYTERTKDMVFWLYEAKATQIDNNGIITTRNVIDPNAAYHTQSDKLFQLGVGDKGIRAISNHYKYCPWERYPEL